MQVVVTTGVMKNLHMNGGVDKASYSMNSSLQKKAISITRPIIEQAVKNILVSTATSKDTTPMKTMGIADLGCSSGPNTLFLVSFVLDIVLTNCHQLGYDLPELFVFLNDLPGNDFNTIFRSLLPSYYNQLRKITNADDEAEDLIAHRNPSCFVTGVPGSFYGRLFPSKSLHYVHSSFSLHWLSQVPRDINESNKGNVYISKSSPPGVRKAYLKQFQSDFLTFLKARSEEVVHGGGMVLTLLGRRSKDPSSGECCYIFELLAMALNDMVSEGRIEEEKFNSFNVPVYKPFPKEVESAVKSEGSFEINQLETFDVHWDSEFGMVEMFDKSRSSANVANCLRAVWEPLLVGHFGDEEGLMDDVFRRFREIVEDSLSRETTNYVNLVVSLKRK